MDYWLDEFTPYEAWRTRDYRRTSGPGDIPPFLQVDDGRKTIWLGGDRDRVERRIGELLAAYLPPAHRRLLAEAIGAEDFAEEGEGEWQNHPLFVTVRSRLCCGKTVSIHWTKIVEPPSSWFYWCGQCPRCGVISWHRGAERRGPDSGRYMAAAAASR
jgi:ssDNA-binding Zn-finger/Zn-ribbon topoisomerase 1